MLKSSRGHDVLLPLGEVLAEELFARRGWEDGEYISLNGG